MKDFQKEFGEKMIASVSRSFYLSLRFLPSEMRGTASLAYLLARATDTVADTSALPEGDRVESLEAMGLAINGGGEALNVDPSFLKAGISEGEKMLLQKWQHCLEWLQSLNESRQLAIRKVMRSIIKGQSDDLRNFSGNDFAALNTEEELDQYTYDVAGSVGVFWTEIGFDAYGSDFAELEYKEMTSLGENYGKGLQLLNILRDFPEDIASGRCYFPGPFSDQDGEMIWNQVMAYWQKRCSSLLQSSADYIESLNGSRVRFATSLPALIGARTLRLIENADWDNLCGRIKVSRGEVKRIMLKAGLAGRKRLSRMISTQFS
ncbi:MAG: squalene/phytoene synthase family protein [Akkermansiaceae bacterium]|jgi:farnesyl-diphosphate farnesyltransferase|nr:squalene/phytoene synthase family protein [Akkermansiaceae bacterium]